MAAHDRIVILSDTHLGKPGRGAGSAAALRPLWAGADRVIFNGDTVETRTLGTRADAARHLDELRRLTDEDGVELVLIAGNHDPLVCETDWLTLCGGAVVVTHGDLLQPAVVPWSGLHVDGQERESTGQSAQVEAARRVIVRDWRRQQLARFESHDHHAWQRWGRRLRKVAWVLHYWRTFPGRAERFAAEHFPGCRFFVFGHIHRPGVWTSPAAPGGRPGVTVINTGAYMLPRRPRAVVIESGVLSFYKVRRRRGYRLAATPLRRFNLRDHAGGE